MKLKKIEKDNSNFNIKIVDQKNIGVAKTRNKGINITKGKYLMFIDNDDWILENYVKEYHDKIKSTHADIVVGGFRRINSKGKEIKENMLIKKVTSIML